MMNGAGLCLTLWAQYYWWVHDEPELPITDERLYDYAQHYVYMG
jgi:hypothetical protein